MLSDVINSVRRNEYTGEDRCYPCTLINLVIAGILGLGISRRSKPIGVVVFVISALLIYLRGYLIPGTPILTKRYLPRTILRWFGKDPSQDISTGFGTTQSTDADNTSIQTAENTNSESERDTQSKLSPEQYLRHQNVVKPCEDADDLCLTTKFENNWFDELEKIDEDDISAADVASLIENDPDDNLEVIEYDTARILELEGDQIGKWPSHAALMADVAAARVFEKYDPKWHTYEPEQKGNLLASVRLFLETCPKGGGEVTMKEETVESCCQSQEIVAVTCDDTGETLFEHPIRE